MKMKNIIILTFCILTIHVKSQSKKDLFEMNKQLEKNINDLNWEISNLNNKVGDLNDKQDTLLHKQDTLLRVNESLVNKNLELKEDLLKCQNGPENLLQKANNTFKQKKIDKAMEIYTRIIDSYPTSKESIYSKEKIDEINSIRIEIEKEEARKEAEKNLVKEHDEFKKKTFYNDLRGGWQSYCDDCDNRWDPDTKLDLYFSMQDNSSTPDNLRLIIGFSDDDWLFIDQATFLIDGKKYDVYREFQRDHDGGIVSEWADVSVTSSINQLLKAIMKGQEIKVRFTGDQYYDDALISPIQVEAITSMYNLYLKKGGRI